MNIFYVILCMDFLFEFQNKVNFGWILIMHWKPINVSFWDLGLCNRTVKNSNSPWTPILKPTARPWNPLLLQIFSFSSIDMCVLSMFSSLATFSWFLTRLQRNNRIISISHQQLRTNNTQNIISIIWCYHYVSETLLQQNFAFTLSFTYTGLVSIFYMNSDFLTNTIQWYR